MSFFGGTSRNFPLESLDQKSYEDAVHGMFAEQGCSREMKSFCLTSKKSLMECRRQGILQTCKVTLAHAREKFTADYLHAKKLIEMDTRMAPLTIQVSEDTNLIGREVISYDRLLDGDFFLIHYTMTHEDEESETSTPISYSRGATLDNFIDLVEDRVSDKNSTQWTSRVFVWPNSGVFTLNVQNSLAKFVHAVVQRQAGSLPA